MAEVTTVEDKKNFRIAENIAAMKDIVDDNPNVSVDAIVELTDISHGSVHSILHDDL